MNKKMKTGLTSFLGVCLITTMLSACVAERTARSPEQPNGQQQGQNMQQQGLERDNLPGTTPQPGQGEMLGANPENNQGVNPGVNQPNQQTPEQQMAPDRQKAENIKNQLKNMKEVEDANVIVMGNTALVGCKTSANVGDVNAAKNMIANRVKEIDGSITNVAISEQPDIMNKMNKIGNDITNNRSMNEITNEFNEIIRGITPVAK